MSLLIGIGAARAGTSWLHRYLADHPGCHAPPLKEMHWFDDARTGRAGPRIKAMRREIDRMRANGAPASRIARVRRYLSAFVERDFDDARYLGAMSDGAAPGALRFEITPSYSLLDEATLARMAALEEGAARFVFVMRDPVARVWSNIRLGAARREGPTDRAAREMMEEALLPEGERHRIRSAYADILPKLACAVPRGRLFTAFYEELHRQETLDALCDFAGIARRPADTRRRVNAAAPLPLDPDLSARARAVLDPHYVAARAIMGRVPDAWLAPQEMTT